MITNQRIRGLGLSVAFVLFASLAPVSAAPLTAEQSFPIWPNTVENNNPSPKETVIERSKVAAIRDRAWVNITQSELLAFPTNKPSNCSIVLAPGGGYQRVVFDKEGLDIVPALNEHGLNVFILKYRLPNAQSSDREWQPLEDAQRAVRFIRAHAKEWQINNQCVGILGFSAGGQLASSLASQFDRSLYTPIDSADTLSARPDFVGLMYPVITMEKKYTHNGTRKVLLGESPSKQQIQQHSAEKWVTENTPPAFIGLANDDKSVNQMNSIRFYEALHENNVPVEMHIFQKSGHGFGIRNAKGTAKEWLPLFTQWLEQNQFAG